MLISLFLSLSLIRVHSLTTLSLLSSLQSNNQLLCSIISNGGYAGSTLCDDIQRIGRAVGKVSEWVSETPNNDHTHNPPNAVPLHVTIRMQKHLSNWYHCTPFICQPQTITTESKHVWSTIGHQKRKLLLLAHNATQNRQAGARRRRAHAPQSPKNGSRWF